MMTWRFNPWTTEYIDRLRALIDEKKSASVIAAELGLTRNQVIGKATRLGLRINSRHANNRAKDRPAPVRVERRGPARLVGKRKRPDAQPAREPVEALDWPKGVTLLDLHPRACRWPYGDRRFTFCGAEAAPGRPYCSKHYALSYTPKGAR